MSSSSAVVVDFITGPAWKSNLVQVMEASYVFTNVTWPMYQLIPIELRPKFWVGFNRMAYVDRYQVIYHHVMIDVLENELKWPDVLAVTFACPEALSLARRTEDAINNVVTVSIPSMKELRVGHKVTVGQINPTKLYYNGKPFDFRADIELSEAIKEVVEKMQDTPYRDKTSCTAVRGLVRIIKSIYMPSSKLDKELDDLIYSMIRSKTAKTAVTSETDKILEAIAKLSKQVSALLRTKKEKTRKV